MTQKGSRIQEYEKRMIDTKATESRQLLKERFAYPVFLYDAEHVGITATGEQDTCELYPSDALGLPADMTAEETALVQHRRFRKNPESFMLTEAGE